MSFSRLLVACAIIRPIATNAHSPKSNLPARAAKMPAIAAEMNVMISTAARVAISHFAIASSPFHSSRLNLGTPRRARPHTEVLMSTILGIQA